jgi:YidC/Oxa1 family membrane protein insertase
MDKNTITGLVLMAAIMFGFMYLTKPSDEEIAAAQARQEQAEARKSAAKTEQAAVSVDSLTGADAAALAAVIRTSGTATSDNPGVYTFSNDHFDLQLDETGVSGTALIAGRALDIKSVLNNTASLSAAEAAQAADAVHALIAEMQKYKSFAQYLGGEVTETTLENDLIKVDITSRGAMVKQVTLKEHMTERSGEPEPIQLFKGDSDGYGFTFTTSDQRLNTREFNFKAVEVSDTTVTMALSLGENAQWAIRYTLLPGEYIVKMEVLQNGMANILPASTASMDFNWDQKLARNEVGKTFEERNSAIYYKYVGESPDELSGTSDDDEQLSGRIKWVSFKNQYFSSVIIAKDYFSSADLTSTVIKDSDFLKQMDMAATLPYSTADGVAASFDFYFGPNKYPLLSSLDERIDAGEDLELTRLVPLGLWLFRWINRILIIPVFTFISSFCSNYGIIILLLTLFIKIIIFPFTYKSFKSQARMRILSPEIKALQEKYPGQENAMRLQQETMALYSKAGASPFSGCLPMILQMPILIAMFTFFPSAIELRGQSFLWAHDLSAPDSILTLPFNIPFYGDHVSLFCLLMTIVNVIYIHLSMQNQPASASMAGMKWMQYLMPVMFLFFFNDYASGLSYYYFLSLLITIIQTWAFRKFVDEDKVRAEMAANAKKPRKKSGFMARLEEAQRQQQAYLRQQAKEQAKRRK